jgi:hypothetical protein
MRKTIVNGLILASIPGMLFLSGEPFLKLAGGVVCVIYALWAIYDDILWQHSKYR